MSSDSFNGTTLFMGGDVLLPNANLASLHERNSPLFKVKWISFVVGRSKE